MSVTTSSAIVGSFTREVFEAHLERVQHLPAWWLDRQRAAYERFATLPMPNRTDEGWRFSSLSGLTLDGFSFPSAKDAAPIALPLATAGALVFSNNRVVRHDPMAVDLATQGVIFDTLHNALLNHRDLIKEHLLAQPSRLGSDKFAALHEAFLEDGAFVYVPKGIEVAAPFLVTHLAFGAVA